jgi:hypothetical protein
LKVTLGDQPTPLNDATLERFIPVETDPSFFIVNVGRTGFTRSDKLTEKLCRPYNTERNRNNREYEDQKLRFVTVQAFFNEVPDNRDLNKILARIVDKDQRFSCNWYPDITGVFVAEVRLERGPKGKYTYFEKYDSKIDLLLMDVNYREEGANLTPYREYRDAIDGGETRARRKRTE